MASADVDVELQRWVTAQLLFWEGQDLSLVAHDEFLHDFNESSSDAFVFLIRDRGVSLMPKPKHFGGEHPGSENNGFILRANSYRRFFEDVIREHCPDLECRLAMSMDDRAPTSMTSSFPIFAFQKPRGSHAILLPDIDAIEQDFYINERDPLFYADKINKAVFVGSTTGMTHTLKSVHALSNERLRLGKYFQNAPNVTFHLPNIVQCDSSETEDAIRALGFGSGTLSWQQQFRYRFLLSMDGNGATCSRVAMALKSNSVLLKFASEHLLYYFDGLEPYRDYIPIKYPDEVLAIINAERHSPARCESIAKGGAAFFETYLSRAPALRYSAMLLQRYAEMFARKTKSSTVSGKCIAHLSNLGDVMFDLDGWVGSPDSDSAIEGFEIDFSSGLENGDLTCRFLGEHGGNWTTVTHGGFVGSRGRATPLYGLAFELTGIARERYDCVYRCVSVDGDVTEFFSSAQYCECGGSAIGAFQLKLEPIQNPGASPKF
jgi:hypothetical protein